MILVLGGTVDGRLIAAQLQQRNLPVCCSVVSDYGRQLLQEAGVKEVFVQQLDLASLQQFLHQHQVKVVIDATHPFAENITRIAQSGCETTGIPYFRYQRGETVIPDHPLIHLVETYEQAAKKACSLGRTIFLTIGSNKLKLFVEEARKAECRVIARVLPEVKVIDHCRELGLLPRDILALQGPFQRNLNIELLKHTQADVLVTKDSGKQGGFDDKLAACLELGLPIVVISQPSEPNLLPDNNVVAKPEELITLVRKVYRQN